LKQGLGRLLRSTTDRGVVAVLDPRIVTKRYGKSFLRSLPPYRVVREMAACDEFFGDGSVE
jgi:ATP-dependent DNA helicase DinG